MRAIASGLALIGLASGATGCLYDLIGKGCSDVGCALGVKMELGTIPEAGLAELEGAWVEVCLNGACVGAALGQLPGRGEYRAVRLTPDQTQRLWVDAELQRNSMDGALTIDVSYDADDYRRFDDGDVFDLALARADGSLLIGRSWLVPEYVTTMPNGHDCEPTCRTPIRIQEL